MNQTTISLLAQERTPGKTKALRSSLRVPAVVYGYKFESMPISVSHSDILKLYRDVGKSSLIDLIIEKKKIKVLLHDMNIHPVKRTIEHVDFYAVNVKEKTDVEIPFDFVGESPAVKDHNGLLTTEHDILTLRCLPTEIPQNIPVDLGKLVEIGDSLKVSDLAIDSEKYEIMDLDPETVVATVVAPRMAQEEEEAEESPESVEVPSEHGSEDSSPEDKKD